MALNFEAFNHIPTEEIEQDLKDTETEIKDFEIEIEALSRDRAKNRLEIYIREGKILERSELASKLKSILAYRKSKEPKGLEPVLISISSPLPKPEMVFIRDN